MSYESAYNDDDFGFGSVENNSGTFSPENHNHRNCESETKTVKNTSRHHHALNSKHPTETHKKKE